jgi:predicted nucleic acid-binding protein
MDDILIYMDCSCLCTPYDDITQNKTYIEGLVILTLLSECVYGPWKLVGSDILEYEIAKISDIIKKNAVLVLYETKTENIKINETIIKRANEIQKYGIKLIDSLHFASAEYKKVNVLLTFDKDFIKASKRVDSLLMVQNPINWFTEEFKK